MKADRRETSRKYYADNREVITRKKREYHARTREKRLRDRRSPAGRYVGVRGYAARSGKDFTLPMGVYHYLSMQPCVYCGGKTGETGIGLDRIDNARGYHLDNVLPACGTCNAIRSNKMSPEEAYVVINLLKGLRKEEVTND